MGVLFINISGTHLSYVQFKDMFQTALTWAGVRGQMSPHSIQIGAATYAAKSGYSDAAIQKSGR